MGARADRTDISADQTVWTADGSMPSAPEAITLQPAPALLTITGYAPLLATTILPDAASLTVTGLAPAVAAALYPAPGDVRYGVIYGPDGIYTGTLRNSGGVWLRRR